MASKSSVVSSRLPACHWIGDLEIASAHQYEVLKRTFDELSIKLQDLSLKQRSRPKHLKDDLEYEREFDAATEKMWELCAKLCASRATSIDHLKLKAAALLYLMPEEANPIVCLAESLCNDINCGRF